MCHVFNTQNVYISSLNSSGATSINVDNSSIFRHLCISSYPLFSHLV